MSAIAYLKQQCGWSRGVREVLAKYGVDYEERQIHIQENFIEMVEKTGQTNQPCVQLNDNLMLVDISGEELADYFDEQNVCLLYTSPSPRDGLLSRMPSSA